MTSKKVVLLAGGGHGQVVLDALLRQGVVVTGILDAGLSIGQAIFSVPVLGSDDWLHGHRSDEFFLANGAGATAQNSLRRKLFEQWTNDKFSFASVLHPSAIVARGVTLVESCQIMAGAVIQPNAYIGANAVINTRASIDHDCYVSEHAFIAPGAILCGGVRVGVGAFIGAGAVVLPGVRIGANASIGAGATVTKDVLENQLVAGCPAKPIGQQR